MASDWEPQTFDFLGIEWDNEKAESNKRKHGIDFEDASRIFKGYVVARAQFENGEDRWQCVGLAKGEELLVVIAERKRNCRIISARRATRRERQWYYSFFT